jgi:hypothetical protein
MARSVLESERITENRTRQERRVGSGNVRAGQARVMREVDALSSSKTGPDRPRARESNRTRAGKRAPRR